MAKYEALSKQLNDKMISDIENGTRPQVAFLNKNAVRRHESQDGVTVWRPTFVKDIDKIMYCPFYNRYTDKTQVFSLWKNDDITRRSLHVQLVSRISRAIGAALNLNLDLIEAIALGHDIGHPPFAHTGETFLDQIHYKETGRHFYHNIQSVRVLDKIFPYNMTLQTLDGIAAHNGEVECEQYQPTNLSSFEQFDKIIEDCYTDPMVVAKMMPCTLEGSVVRISDIIAYLGKDRHDAMLTKLTDSTTFSSEDLGSINSEIINNLIVNVIENSYGKPYIKLDEEHFAAIRSYKLDNYAQIYNQTAKVLKLDKTVKPMMEEIYGQLYSDLVKGNKNSPIYTQHIDYVNVNSTGYERDIPYEKDEPHQIVVDYIASMTDNYFIELHAHLFPSSPLKVEYKGYFD